MRILHAKVLDAIYSYKDSNNYHKQIISLPFLMVQKTMGKKYDHF